MALRDSLAESHADASGFELIPLTKLSARKFGIPVS